MAGLEVLRSIVAPNNDRTLEKSCVLYAQPTCVSCPWSEVLIRWALASQDSLAPSS